MQQIIHADGLRRCVHRRGSSDGAFTLVELLVTVMMVFLLVALMLPTLVSAREKTRRNNCRDNLRQFLLGLHMYGNDNVGRLPTGLSENSNGEDEHVPVVSARTRKSMVQYSGNARVLECPGLMPPFNSQQGWYYTNYGFVLGYNYLGGHTETPWPVTDELAGWVSPQTVTAGGQLAMVTDLNDWSRGFGKAFAPHGKRGPIIKDEDAGNWEGATSRDLGAAGGNVGLLDGSVNWKNIRSMQTHYGSRIWGSDGCFAAW